MKVLIVGGGIGGLAVAAFLKESGIEYDIVEKCSDWSHHGYLIGLWDNGRDILKKLGLADRLDAAGNRVRHTSLRDGQGNPIRDYSLSSLYAEFGGAVTIIGRKELHGWLHEKVGNTKLSMGQTVTKISSEGAVSTVTFSDGSKREYDVVVGADGVHSVVRRLVFGKETESFPNWRAWYVWIDHAYDVPATMVTYVEAREYITTFAAGGKTLATLIAPVDHTQWDTQEGRIERLKTLFKDESHIVPAALEKLKDEDAMPTDLADVDMRHTVQDNVALIGDAAHCFGPIAGLGTSMALEDAYVLASELLKVHATYPVAAALAEYEEHRKKRIGIARRLNYRMRAGALITSRPWAWAVMRVAQYMPEWFFAKDLRKLLREEI